MGFPEGKMKMGILPPGVNRERKGFTLIELSVVLFILSLVMLTVLPKISRLAGESSGDALRKIALNIETTLEGAVFESATGEIIIDIPGGSIKDMRGEGKDEARIWSTSLPSHLTILSVLTNFGKSYRNEKVRIPYASTGYMPRTSIYLKEKEEDKSYTVQINPFTGKVSILEGIVTEKS